jgi:hypothetical protein
MNNEKAFPNPHLRSDDGITVRDYFAAKAMEAFISGWIERNIYPPNDLVVAEHAYSLADAMLKTRSE